MYSLTLTAEERRAIDWVGDRYNSGKGVGLVLDCNPADRAWSDDGDITFPISEHVASEDRDETIVRWDSSNERRPMANRYAVALRVTVWLMDLRMSESMSVSSRALFNAAQPSRPLLADLHGVLDGLVEQIGIVTHRTDRTEGGCGSVGCRVRQAAQLA